MQLQFQNNRVGKVAEATCRNFLLFILASVFVFAMVGCPTSTTTPVYSAVRGYSVKYPNVKLILVTCQNGDIEIIQDPSAVIFEAKIEFKCSAQTQAEADKYADSTLPYFEGTITDGDELKTRYELNGKFPPAIPSINIDTQKITIRAATLEGINVQTSNGKLSLVGFTCPATLQTSSGGIHVKGHSGSITMKSSNGALEATDINGPVIAETFTGLINVSLNATAQANVDLLTFNGMISLELPQTWQGSVQAVTDSGSIVIDGGSRASDIIVNDGRGSMTLGDATKSKATLKTSNGGVTVKVNPTLIILPH